MHILGSREQRISSRSEQFLMPVSHGAFSIAIKLDWDHISRQELAPFSSLRAAANPDREIRPTSEYGYSMRLGLR